MDDHNKPGGPEFDMDEAVTTIETSLTAAQQQIAELKKKIALLKQRRTDELEKMAGSAAR